MSRWNIKRALGLALILAAHSANADAQQPVHTDLRPRVVRRPDGERRYLADGRFILLKVGPVTTGANYLFMGSEDLPPGTAIPSHEHEVDEEILIVHRGRVRVVFDRDSSEATAGDAVFLPPRTRVSVRTLGPDTASIFFVFPRASVERCFQYVGRAEGETTPRAYTRADTAEALRACQMTYF
ncbi:MAG TPA: cupin domain-containing protein [bacterium]|nr:cupin domain-containing protein [bacterium]